MNRPSWISFHNSATAPRTVQELSSVGSWGVPTTKASLPARSIRATYASSLRLSIPHRVTNVGLSEKLPVASTAFGFDPNA